MLRLVIALALAVAVCGSAVEIASLDDLRGLISKTKYLAVEFYAPWCGHCKNLAPHWKAAAEELATAGVPVTLAMLDADAHRDAGQEYGVQGFPTIKFFRDGVPSDYNGPREKEGIVTYFKRATGDHVVTATSPSDWAKTIEEFPISVLFVTDGAAHSGIVQSIGDSLWETVAFVHLKDSRAGWTDPRFNCAAAPCAFIHRKNFENEEAVLVYNGDFSSESLIAFINSNKLRSYGRFSQEDRSIVQAFFETKRAYKAIICINDGNSEQLTVAAAVPAALKALGLDDVFVGVVGSEFSQALSHFGVDESELPSVIVHGNSNGDDKRKFKGTLPAFSAGDIAKFVKGAAEGSIPRWVKSEAAPTSNTGAVKIITGNTVQEIVLDETKDVLVEIYAPWCGHCKSLEPVFESVAVAFAGEPRVVVAKLDGTKNDFDLFPVQGFPTLLVFPAHSKTPRTVQGRDAQTLIQAVVSNSAFTDLKIDREALPKSGIVPRAVAEMFPMLEEGVLALQSNVLFGPFTAFHFIVGALVIFVGFTIVMLRSGTPKQNERVAAPVRAPAPAPASAPAPAPAPASDANVATEAAPVDADPSDAIAEPKEAIRSRGGAAKAAAAASPAASAAPEASVPTKKSSGNRTKKE